MDENAKKIASAKIQDLSSQLKDSDNLENWLVLGVYRKIIGDYEGAKEVWDTPAPLGPKTLFLSITSASFYAYYLKNNKKAEENYAKSHKK